MAIKGQLQFLYPWMLLLLLLIPGLLTWFFVQQRQYWHDAFEFSQLALLKQLKHAKHPLLAQRIVPLCLLIALSLCIVGLAQPVLRTKVATQNSYLMLVLDISISMEATDLPPNRLEAAKHAAIDFVRELPDGVRLGLEFFAGNNYLVSPPIADHQQIIAYLESLQQSDLRPGTAMGDALLTAMESLQSTVSQKSLRPKKSREDLNQPQGAIILLTDGESNLGISPLAASEEALKRKIEVFTVGMGEETGAYVRGSIFTHLDEATLQTIAQQTGGDYYRARRMNDFQDIYRKITHKTIGYEEKDLSLMPWCLGLGAIFILISFCWTVYARRF